MVSAGLGVRCGLSAGRVGSLHEDWSVVGGEKWWVGEVRLVGLVGLVGQ